MNNFLLPLALSASSEKNAAIVGLGLAFAAYRFGRTSNNRGGGRRAATAEQVAELRSAIAHVHQDLQDFKAHVFSILDEQTALAFAADVYGVERTISGWLETGDPTAAKGAMSLAESLDFRFVNTLSHPPDFLSDETTVLLGRLYVINKIYLLTIHVLNGLSHWSDNEAEALQRQVDVITRTLKDAQVRLRLRTYSLCHGRYEEEMVSPGGAGEPRQITYSLEYGLSKNGASCEIVQTARWMEYSIDDWRDTRWAVSRIDASRAATEAVKEEINRRATREATEDLAEYVGFLQQLVAE